MDHRNAADTTHHTRTQFTLRRANAIPNDSYPAREDSSLLLQDSIRPKDRFGASIKRRFKEVKEVSIRRSKSLSRSSPSPLPGKHVRSYSAVLSQRPLIVGPGNGSPHLESALVIEDDEETPLPTSPDFVDTPTSASTVHSATVPLLLEQGTQMTKVSAKQTKRVALSIDPDQGLLQWNGKILPIERIKEVRSGQDARYDREHLMISSEYEPRWLTIVYILDGKYKSLHLIAPTISLFKMWDTAIRTIHAIRQELMTGLGNHEMRQAVWEKQCWKRGDDEPDKKMAFEEVEKLCRRLNVNSPSEELYRLFKQADGQNRGYLDFQDFKEFVKLLKGRPELALLYNKLRSVNQDIFDFSVFSNFMRNSQKSALTSSELKSLFDKHASMVQSTTESLSVDYLTSTYCAPAKTMTLQNFTSFLLSPDNTPLSDQGRGVWQDMKRPLSDYFISSSHNTYLVGHQLVGASTVEGYIRALLHGCRSVEVDIYDGDTEPLIFHGKTLTSKVPLREVCQAIAKYGFVVTEYPIIISAEVHCSVSQQDMMANIMKDVFGDSLIQAPVQGRPKLAILPCPEDLKRCILLKAKSHIANLEASTAEEVILSSDTSTSSASESERALRGREIEIERDVGLANDIPSHNTRSPMRSPVRMPPSPPLLTPKAVGLVRSFSRRRSRSTQDSPKPKMSFALAALLVYTVGVKYRGINKKEVYAPEHMFSLSEKTCHKVMRQGMMDLIKHSRTHLVRIYPKGMRLSSSNFEPHRFWSSGAQLVAINWQTFDLGYMINHAMFQRNGRSGYVLKPLALRASDKQLLSRRTSHYLNLTIISAQQLPRPKDALGREKMDKMPINPIVEVSLHIPDWTKIPQSSVAEVTSSLPGPIPARTTTYKTNAVKNNGFNPVWDERIRIPFDCVGDMHDLIFVRFTVRQEDKDDDEPLGVYCASLGSLQYGFRHLPLHDSQLSQYLFSTLFIRTDIQDASLRVF